MFRRQNEKGFSFPEVLIVVVMLGLVVFASWKIIHKKPVTPIKKSIATVKQITPEQAVMNDVAKQVDAKYIYMDSPDKLDWIAEMGTGAILNSDNYPYTISSTSFPAVKLHEKAATTELAHPEQYNAEVTPFISEVLKSHGFTLSNKSYKLTTTLGSDTENLTYLAYASPNATCLSIYDLFTGTNTQLSCFSDAAVKDVFSQGKPFIDEYVKIHPEVTAAQITFGPLAIKSQNGEGVIGSSHEAGYDISEAVFEVNNTRKIALFYNHLDGPWTYITQANDEYGFTCDSYKANATIRKVMYDQICLGSSGQVRLDTKK